MSEVSLYPPLSLFPIRPPSLPPSAYLILSLFICLVFSLCLPQGLLELKGIAPRKLLCLRP